MPGNAHARSFPATIRETSNRPSGVASIPILLRPRLMLDCENNTPREAGGWPNSAHMCLFGPNRFGGDD